MYIINNFGGDLMKKIFMILLYLFLIFMLCCCWTNTSLQNNSNQSDNEFANFEGYQKALFSCGEASNLLELTLPNNWEIKKATNKLSIICDDKVVGYIYKSADKPFPPLSESRRTVGDISIYEGTFDNDGTVYRRIIFTYESPTRKSESICIDVEYYYLSKNALSRMMTIISCKKTYTDTYYNLLNGKKDTYSVLIFGNSFLDTSDLANSINELSQGSIVAESIVIEDGQADDFLNDRWCMSRILSMEYDIVLLGGLYPDEKNIKAANTIFSVCSAENIDFAIMPAHNEDRETIKKTLEYYGSGSLMKLLDWKNEIESLIESGISIDYFCNDNPDKNSTPLAGYVGANMIYRAIFGKAPTYDMSAKILSSNELKILHDYLDKGCAKIYTPESTVYYLQ